MIEYSILQFAGIDFPFKISFGQRSESFSAHTHNFTELTIILSGSAEHVVEGNSYSISRGEVFAILPSFKHELRNVYNLVLCNLMFDLDKLMLLDNELKKLLGFQSFFILEPFHRYTNSFTSRLFLNEEQLEYVIMICRNMEQEYIRKSEGYRIIIKSYLLSLISFISRNVVPIGESVSEKLYKIAPSISFIEENYTQKITLSQLAKMVFLSERQYSRIFNYIYQISPITYLINCRLNHACHLLVQTQLSLNEIAENCGIGDKVYFSKLFRSNYGITPGQYRKKLIKKELFTDISKE